MKIIRLPISKILAYSYHKLNTGQLTMERNLDCMKQWSEEEISEIFNDKGYIKGNLSKRKKGRSGLEVTANHCGARVVMVKSTRRHTIAALRKIFKEEKLVPSKSEYERMARDLISEENIRNKFVNCSIEYDSDRYY